MNRERWRWNGKAVTPFRKNSFSFLFDSPLGLVPVPHGFQEVFLKQMWKHAFSTDGDEADILGWPGQYCALALLSQFLVHNETEASIKLYFLRSFSISFLRSLCSSIKPASSSPLFVVFISQLCASSFGNATPKHYWNTFVRPVWGAFGRASWPSTNTIFLNCLDFLSWTSGLSDRPSSSRNRFKWSLPSFSDMSADFTSRLRSEAGQERIIYVW